VLIPIGLAMDPRFLTRHIQCKDTLVLLLFLLFEGETFRTFSSEEVLRPCSRPDRIVHSAFPVLLLGWRAQGVCGPLLLVVALGFLRMGELGSVGVA